jgi:hypothetical protein
VGRIARVVLVRLDTVRRGSLRIRSEGLGVDIGLEIVGPYG